MRQGPGRIERPRAGYFIGGLASVWLGKGYGYIDTTGNPKIEGVFDEADSFHDGRARVKHGRYGFIDSAGAMVIETKFTRASDFSEGLSPVAEKEWAIGLSPPVALSTSRARWLQPAFHSAESFQDDLCLVTTEDSIGYINKLGEFV